MTGRPFRFGLAAATAASRRDWQEKARQAEALGFSTLLLPDHFGDHLAPIAALMAAADATTTLRIGSYVFDNDYRHPVVLAKEAATLDLLSEGRFELGLGAGWHKQEYDQAGIPFDPPATRVDRFEEGLRIVKDLLRSEGPVQFAGRHYRIEGMEGRPSPVQQPHPPILVGAGGKRMLSLAGQEANIIGIVARSRSDGGGLDTSDVTSEATDRKVGWIRAAAGERFDEIELNIITWVVQVTENRRAAAEQLGQRFGAPPALVLDCPHLLLGTQEEIINQLLAQRERFGISYVMVFDNALEAIRPIVARLAGR